MPRAQNAVPVKVNSSHVNRKLFDTGLPEVVRWPIYNLCERAALQAFADGFRLAIQNPELLEQLRSAKPGVILETLEKNYFNF